MSTLFQKVESLSRIVFICVFISIFCFWMFWCSHGYFSHAYFHIVRITKRTIEIFTLPAVGAWFCSPAGQKARTLKCLNSTFRDIVKLSNEEIHSRKSSYVKDVTMWTIKKLIYFLVFWHSFKQFEHNWLVVYLSGQFRTNAKMSSQPLGRHALQVHRIPKRYRCTAQLGTVQFFMFETWFNEVVWKCDRWPQTE